MYYVQPVYFFAIRAHQQIAIDTRDRWNTQTQQFSYN